MKKTLLLLALLPSVCFGYEVFTAYPPSPPYSRDRSSAENYRDEVEEFVVEAKDFVERMNEEIERIRKEQEEAIRSANRAVEEYNDWAMRSW